MDGETKMEVNYLRKWILLLRMQLNLNQKFQWKYVKILLKVNESQKNQTYYKRSNKCIPKNSLFQLSLCYAFCITILFVFKFFRMVSSLKCIVNCEM